MLYNKSFKYIFFLISFFNIFSMLIITFIIFSLTSEKIVLISGFILMLLSLIFLLILAYSFGKRLSYFTSRICKVLDNMINGNEISYNSYDNETSFDRINHHLNHLYNIMNKNNCKIDREHQELQELISDISHQIRTPINNINILVDILQRNSISDSERVEFTKYLYSQTDKLNFLFQALVKTSQLEVGLIKLEKTNSLLYNTIAQSLSGIIYAAEEKKINIEINCDESLIISHDSKWTTEAIFNILDNAVKYTPIGGKVTLSVVLGEMYVEIKITDTGKGIAENNKTMIFKRFFRENDVHDIPGIGIGLYLTQEIISKQGGYIRVISSPGKGSSFSILLPLY